MKNKRSLRFLSFMFLMMVSGISFTMENMMENYTAIADNLPITSIAPDPENNNLVAILRRGKVDGQPKDLMEIVNFDKKTRRIMLMVLSDKENMGIEFNEEGKLALKRKSDEEYEMVQINSGCSIKNKKTGEFLGNMVMNFGGFFTLNPKRNRLAYHCRKPDGSYARVVRMYSIESTVLEASIKSIGPEVRILAGGAVTAVAFGKNDELLIGRRDNILEKMLLSDEYNDEYVESDQCYDLNTFNVIEVVDKDGGHDLNRCGFTEAVQKMIEEE